MASQPDPLSPPRRRHGRQLLNWTAPATALGARLYAARLASGLTITQIARAVGATRSALLTWERGAQQPPCRSLDRLARLLHVPYEELLALGDYPLEHHEQAEPSPEAVTWFSPGPPPGRPLSRRPWLALGTRLADGRRACGWTQRACAAVIGWSDTSVRAWEQGRLRPSRAALQRLAVQLDIPYKDLAALAGYAAGDEPA